MLLRTHLVITIFGILILFPLVENKTIFVIVALIATCLPDIDSENSFIGRKRGSGIIRFFTKHRGFIHSFTFLILLSIIFALFVPVIALGFFLGYGLHLFADSFTFEGIYPFWPLREKSSWRVSTGGKSEKIIFVSFVILDILVFVGRIGSVF